MIPYIKDGGHTGVKGEKGGSPYKVMEQLEWSVLLCWRPHWPWEWLNGGKSVHVCVCVREVTRSNDKKELVRVCVRSSPSSLTHPPPNPWAWSHSKPAALPLSQCCNPTLKQTTHTHTIRKHTSIKGQHLLPYQHDLTCSLAMETPSQRNVHVFLLQMTTVETDGHLAALLVLACLGKAGSISIIWRVGNGSQQTK